LLNNAQKIKWWWRQDTDWTTIGSANNHNAFPGNTDYLIQGQTKDGSTDQVVVRANDHFIIPPAGGGGEPAAQTLARTTRGDASWRLVRYMPPAASASAWNWHNIDDDLAGTSTYGESGNAMQAWSVQFGTFTHYMLGACDMSLWGEITKAEYDDTPTSAGYMNWVYSATSCVTVGTVGANRKSGNGACVWVK
jgi:hypothetical protein